MLSSCTIFSFTSGIFSNSRMKSEILPSAIGFRSSVDAIVVQLHRIAKLSARHGILWGYSF